MNRMKFFSLSITTVLFASLTLGQTAEPNASSSTREQNQAVNSAEGQPNAQPASIAPEVAVPGATDAKDKAGRVVQPITGVASQAPPPVPAPEQQQFSQNVKDVYFDFDRWELRGDDQATLSQDAEWLKLHPDVMFTIAGQADPRGSIWYNLFLSDQRAIVTRDALLRMGVSPQQIVFAEGWGKLYEVCEQQDESCWSQERRAHLDAWSPNAGPLTGSSATATGEH